MSEPVLDVRIAYAFAFREARDGTEFVARTAALGPEVIVSEQAVTVVAVRSPSRYSTADLSGRHGLIDDDLAALRKEWPEFGTEYPVIDDRVVGTRWPVLLVVDHTRRTGPAEATVDPGWDNLVIRQADAVLERQLLRIVAVTLARFRILEWCISACRSILSDLQRGGSSVFDLEAGSLSLARAHDEARIARVMTDPRVGLYWGCERRLVTGLYESWSMHTLEESAEEALSITTEVIADRRSALTMVSSRQTSIALLALTVISGVSSVASLIEFSTDNTGFGWAWMPRGLIALAMAAASLGLLVVLRSQFRSSRHTR